MTDSPTTESVAEAQAPVVGDKGMALVAYILFFLFPIAGVVISYIKRGDADDVLKSHYTFQIRTFWISTLFFIVSFILSFVLIGLLLLPLVGIWYLVRVVIGLVALNDGKPIKNPSSWMFG